MKSNRICYICGKTYYFCRSCAEGRNKPSWMQMFCCQDCKDLNTILSAYTAKKITIEEAKELLADIDVKHMCKNNEDTQRVISKIMAHKIKKNKTISSVETEATTQTDLTSDVVDTDCEETE